MKLTVRQRIWGGFLTISMLLLFIGGNSLFRISNIDSSAQQVNTLSLPALERSAVLQVEFSLMGKIAQGSFYATDLNELSALETQLKKRQAEFEATYQLLQKVVEDTPKLRQGAREVDESYRQFSHSVSGLLKDKRLEIELKAQILNQFDELEMAAEDSTTVVLDILDLEELETLNSRAYSAANSMENNYTSILTVTTDIMTVKELNTLEIVSNEKQFVAEELERNITLIQEVVSQLDPDLIESLLEYKVEIIKHVDGPQSIAANQKRLIEAGIQTRLELESTEKATNAALSHLSDLLSEASLVANQLQAEVSKDVNSANLWTWSGMLIAIIIAIGVALRTVNRITKPLAEVNRILNVVAQGDMTRTLDDSAQDEFGELARNCNTLIQSLRELITGIVSRSTQLAAAAEETSTITTESMQAIKAQQAQLEQAATATTEMSSTSHGVSNSAHQALDEIKNADQEASRVQGISGETRDTIVQLAQEVESASNVINRLHQDSASIGGILDVIRGIAEQTNLLALNAAIEAARAGEQGRGFAVVADEVRSLASKTQESTQEIQAMIESLQSGAEEAVRAMSTGKDRAESCVTHSDLANEALNSIIGAVSQAHDVSEEISTAANEQQQVAQEISERLESIVAIAEQTATGATQTSTSSSEVAVLAEELRQSVAQFKI